MGAVPRQAQLGRRRPRPAWDTHGFPGLCEGLWGSLSQGSGTALLCLAFCAHLLVP